MGNKLTALFGGTFDPIHYGHLHPVIALAKEVKLSHVSLLPNHIPPHKPQPKASTIQRLEMLKLAIQDYPLFSIDMREITQAKTDRPSYTIETLQNWRSEHGYDNGLAFIMGQDSLLNLPTWNGWQRLLNYCHLLICRRPDYAKHFDNKELQEWIRENKITQVENLHSKPYGFIYFADTPLKNISATEIRNSLSNKNHDQLLPSAVWNYIKQQHLYNT